LHLVGYTKKYNLFYCLQGEMPKLEGEPCSEIPSGDAEHSPGLYWPSWICPHAVASILMQIKQLFPDNAYVSGDHREKWNYGRGYIFNTQVPCVHSLLSLPISHFVTYNNAKEKKTALVLAN